MANYRNQKTIQIEPFGELQHMGAEDKQQFLLALNWDALLNIMTDLDPPTYILWQYLLKWRGKDGGYDFSPADLKINFGWSENSSRKYLKNLEELGYLIEKTKNKYVLIPYPENVKMRAAFKREQNRNNRG